MNIALNSKVTADKSRETYRETSGQFDDTAFSGAARELAQMSVAQTREAYKRSKTRMLSKQQWTLWRDPLTRWARAQRR